MVNKSQKLKHLSRSILLEEEGLPKANQIIIVAIFLMVASFVVWSLYMEMEEKLYVDGYIYNSQEGKNGLSFVLKIPPRELDKVTVGQPVTIQFHDDEEVETIHSSFTGSIKSISNDIMRDLSGNAYYEAISTPYIDDKTLEYYSQMVEDETKINGGITIGTRSLFTYMLRPVYKAFDNALKEP